jgi:hypothetical protein
MGERVHANAAAPVLAHEDGRAGARRVWPARYRPAEPGPDVAGRHAAGDPLRDPAIDTVRGVFKTSEAAVPNEERVMKRFTAAVALACAVAATVASSALANHSWNGYHWARTANPFTLKIGDNVSSSWDSHLATTSSDWSQSNVLDTTIVAGGAKGKNCRPTSGRIEVCNGRYGNNGWLGLATIWLQSGTKHIVQGTTKVNDTYFDLPAYNNSAEKQHVMCQEVGHDFGLDHQDESGISLNTCMDYYHNTSDSDTKSTHPNQHDYDELATIYSHLDSSSTIDSVGAALRGLPSHESTFTADLRGGYKVVTIVRWTNAYL